MEATPASNGKTPEVDLAVLNEGLMRGLVRQHGLTEAAELLNVILQAEIVARKKAFFTATETDWDHECVRRSSRGMLDLSASTHAQVDFKEAQPLHSSPSQLELIGSGYPMNP